MNYPKTASLAVILLCATYLIAPSLTDARPTSQSPANTKEPMTEKELQKYEGVVIPSQQVKIIAPFQGILQNVNIKEGDRIKQGEKLAQMDDRVQAFVVEVARQQAMSNAAIERSKAALDEAQLVYDQTNIMVEKHAASNFEKQRALVVLNQAKADYDLAIENKAQMQTNLQLEEERLAEHNIEAPFNGQVIRIHTEPGATLADDEPVVSIASLDPLQVNMYLPIKMFGKLQKGQTYTLIADDPINAPLQGRIKHIDPIIDSASQTFRTVFEIDNSNYKLPAGFTVHLAQTEPSINNDTAHAPTKTPHTSSSAR